MAGIQERLLEALLPLKKQRGSGREVPKKRIELIAFVGLFSYCLEVALAQPK
jgi:hypothetical protein